MMPLPSVWALISMPSAGWKVMRVLAETEGRQFLAAGLAPEPRRGVLGAGVRLGGLGDLRLQLGDERGQPVDLRPPAVAVHA